jgi:hypothetical protein
MKKINHETLDGFNNAYQNSKVITSCHIWGAGVIEFTTISDWHKVSIQPNVVVVCKNKTWSIVSLVR